MKRLVLATLPLLLLSTGCDELEPFLPTVQFESMQLRDLSFKDASVDFVFNVDNPNPVDIGLASFSYDLGLEQINLFSGDDPDGFVLGAEDGSELRLPVTLNFVDTWDAVQATRGEDYVAFDIAGDFGFDTPIGLVELPYDEGGEFPALRTPKFNLGKLRVKNVNLLTQKATVELDVGVDNEHASNLFFDNLNYNMKLGGKDVGNGIIDAFDVEGAVTKDLVIPFEIDLLSAGTTIGDAIINKKPLAAGLDVDMDVDVPFLANPLALTINETGDITVE